MSDSDQPKSPNPAEGIYQRLKQDALEADWTMLEEHHKRGALIYVSSELDLFEVGTQIAMDHVDKIKDAMDRQLIQKVNDEMTKPWSENSLEKQFTCIIVQPYVLMQPRPKSKG